MEGRWSGRGPERCRAVTGAPSGVMSNTVSGFKNSVYVKVMRNYVGGNCVESVWKKIGPRE